MTVAELTRQEISQEVFLTDPNTGDPVSFERVKVTKQMAKKFLSKNHKNNRSLRPKVVRSYAEVMNSGLWQCFSESVKFDKNGVLIDGAHRISAIIESNKSFVYMSILRGLPPESILAIDNGVSRSLQDSFVISGRKMTNISSVTSSVSLLSRLSDTFSKDITYATVEGYWVKNNMAVIEFFDTLKGFKESTFRFFKNYKYTYMSRNFSLGVMVAMHYLFDNEDQLDDGGSVCHSLMMSFESGIPFDGLGTESPCFHVINRIRKIKEVGGRLRFEDQIRLFLWAYQQTLLNLRPKQLPQKQDWLFDDITIKSMGNAKKKLMQ